MRDFVILHHTLPGGDIRTSHWDLMLRANDVLLTWALTGNPLEIHEIEGQRLADHRLKYLEFEGEIADDRGFVQRIASGHFEWLKKTDLENWKIRLLPENAWDVTSCSLVAGKIFKFEVR